MATSGAMADFARMPVRNKILVFVLMGALAGFLYYKLGYKKLKESVTEAKNAAQKAAGDNAALDADLPKFKELRAKKELLDGLIKEHSKALPTESEVPAFFETLERKITEAGVEVNKWSKRPEEAVEQFVRVPLDVELTGNFLQLKKFFASLVEKKKSKDIPGDKADERDRIVSIENLSLTKPIVRNRELVLTATFTAVTYRQGDAVGPVGPVTPSAAGGGAPALPSSGAPMPSASTPQGAKARVEDSLNKIDQRTRDATGTGSGSDRLKGGI